MPAAAAAASGALSTPMAVVKSAVTQAMALFRDQNKPLPQRRRELRDLVAANFDFPEMARSALGPHWKTLPEDKRKQFVELFTAYSEFDFLKQIQEFRDLTFHFIKEIPISPGYAQVNTVVDRPGKQPATLNFSLKQEGANWKAIDVLINGLSLVGGNRTQFGLVIDNMGIDALMSDLQTKRNELEASLK
jgi:phospholipid transport system substrate-binding protein